MAPWEGRSGHGAYGEGARGAPGSRAQSGRRTGHHSGVGRRHAGTPAPRPLTQALVPMSPCPLNSELRRCAVARLVAEARRWLAFATSRGLPLPYACEKALSAVALSVRLALPARPDTEVGDGEACGGIIAFAIPTKLVGTSAFQASLRALRATRAPAGTPLRLSVDRGRVAVFADGRSGGRLLGLVQPKHAWLAPLVGHGATAVLLRVTGDPERGHTLGVNVALVGLGEAVRACERAGGVDVGSAMRLVARPDPGPKPAA